MNGRTHFWIKQLAERVAFLGIRKTGFQPSREESQQGEYMERQSIQQNARSRARSLALFDF